jgi:hypothetical protein
LPSRRRPNPPAKRPGAAKLCQPHPIHAFHFIHETKLILVSIPKLFAFRRFPTFNKEEERESGKKGYVESMAKFLAPDEAYVSHGKVRNGNGGSITELCLIRQNEEDFFSSFDLISRQDVS